MNKTFRFILLLLVLPVMIAAFSLETSLQLSSSGHALVQIGIIAGICWLAWRWAIYDEMCELREVRRSDPIRYHYRKVALVEDAERLPYERTSLPPLGVAQAPNGVMALLPKKMKWAANHRISPARVAHALISVGVVFVLTLVMLLIGSKTLGEGVIAILYLAPIGWCTVRWGQLAGVSAALTAALAFDYLFIPPYRTFNIGSLEGWLLLILFFAMAILIVGRIQTILTEERERERKATFLYEIVAAIANQATREGIARAIANQIQQKFLAKGVQVHLDGGWGYPSLTAYSGNRQSSAFDDKPDRMLRIVSGTVVIGVIDIWQGSIPLPAEDDLMLQTVLNQIVAALDRVRMAEGKAPYPKLNPSFSEGNSLQTSHS